jgi:hypothetical protein
MSNTSSDSLCGHFLIYPLVHDLLAETLEEKGRVLRVVSAVLNHIVSHGFEYYGPLNAPTEWGRWVSKRNKEEWMEEIRGTYNNFSFFL